MSKMKRLTKYGLVIFLLAVFFACQDPLPVELINEENPEEDYDVEVITPKPNSVVFTGYDSTGITSPIPVNSSVISISGIKNTFHNKNITVNKGYAEAVFYDTDQPIKTSSGIIIGYKTLQFGRVRFDEDSARVVPHRIFYRDGDVIRDTLVGVKHVLFYKKRIAPVPSNFPYGKSVRFYFDFFGEKPFLTTIKVPQEISAKLKLTGTKEDKNLRAELSWNKIENDEVEVIIGGVLEGRKEIIPLLRLKSFKGSKIVIRNSLIQKIPYEKYDSIIFSVIRKHRVSVNTIRLGDIYIASQSIHNILINIP